MANERQSNMILAVVLPAVVLTAWGSFHAIPQKPGQEALHPQRTAAEQPQIPAGPESREAVIASTDRIPIDTPRVKGSISLKGGRIDDVSLALHRETVDPSSPSVVLLSPPGGPHPFYAEFGWVGTEAHTKVPGPDTVWRPERPGSLGPGRPIALVYDNGEGLVFRRTIAVDDKYLFTLKDEVANSGAAAVTLFPYGLISRHGTPPTQGYYILHEGMIGVLGDQGLQEVTYKTIDDEKSVPFNVTNAWMGITDKYWATALMPDTDAQVEARFSAGEFGAVKIYQTDYLLGPRTIAPGATGTANARLFAGAKELEVVEGYERDLNLNRFELLIDLGWFHLITKPMYLAIDYLFHLVGNFGVAILIITVIVKGVFFPFANKSYRAMRRMKQLQPQIDAIRAQFSEDRERENKEILELYKRENVTAQSGCLPMVLQLPVFFALYKVLFVAVETRHAPFFGWIKDLSAPDPTRVFNLFGFLPFDPAQVPLIGSFLALGAWPAILGVSVWQLQQKISPTLLGSLQRTAFAALPLLVSLFVAGYAAAWVIFLAWYNLLSSAHQWLLTGRKGGVVGNIPEYSAKVLPYGKIQPIVFLMMLAPVTQNLLMLLVFWRRSPTRNGGTAATPRG